MIKELILGGVRNSAVASQPCPSGHITADKRKIKDFPKLPSAELFLCWKRYMKFRPRLTAYKKEDM